MKPLKLTEARSILCLGAHCDDIEIGCGATMLGVFDEFPGASVHWLVFASTPERAREARSCAERFTAAAGDVMVEILDYRDGFLPYEGGRVKERFEALKGEVEPDLIFTHYRHDLHQDHRLVNELTWNTFRDHTILEYEIPKWDGDMGQPGLYVPVTEARAHAKVEALVECFPSQRGKRWFDADTFLSLMRLRGMEINAPDRYAEAFYARKVTL